MGLNLKFICARRCELGLKQDEIGAQLGMDRASYCKYENGVYKLNAEMIPTLAKVLKCPIIALFTDEPEKPKVETKPPFRGLFESMTRKLIADVVCTPTGDVNPAIIQEIRENLRALGEV